MRKFRVYAASSEMTPQQIHDTTTEICNRIMKEVAAENGQYADTLTQLSTEGSKPGANIKAFLSKMDKANSQHWKKIESLRKQAEKELKPFGMSLAFSSKTCGESITAASLDDVDAEIDQLTNYMPAQGEGETKASQIATAVNKLTYKWWNDGDVYDNSYHLEGWVNDLSDYANWLYMNTTQQVKKILAGISDCYSEDDYESLLCRLVYATSDGEDLENWAKEPKVGSIYNCSGPFHFVDLEEEEDENWEEEEEYEEEEPDDYEDDTDEEIW